MNRTGRHNQGVVLVAVLWIVAALSIIVAGIARSAREETRVVARMRQDIEAQALGGAAIQLALQGMVARQVQPARLEQVEIVYRGVSIAVEIMPLNGLIDINAAPVPLLASLYKVAGGLPDEAAQALAQATVLARDRRGARGSAVRFEAPEDLLQILGFDYELYARLAGFITADLRGSGKVNPLAAPLQVLAVLADGDTSVASRINASRAAGQQSAGVDTTALNPAQLGNTTVRRYRLQARVPVSDGGWQLISRSVDLTPRLSEGMPWHTFHSSSVFDTAGRPAP